jgi:hypothetical protein
MFMMLVPFGAESKIKQDYILTAESVESYADSAHSGAAARFSFDRAFAQPGTIFPVRALRRALGHALPMRLGAAVRSYSPSAFICST